MESDQTTETESDRSDFSDGEMEQFSHNFIPGDRGVGNSEDSDEYGIYYGDSSKYPPMFDTNIDSGATGDLFHSLKQQGEIFDGNQNQNRENIHNIITKLNSSYPDSAYGTGHSLYAINESGSTVTETDSDTNSEGTISNSESPVHNPVYGRYQKLPATLNKPPVVPASEVHSDNSCEMLILHRLPGENLGMILGIEGGKDSFGKVSAVSVKSVTLGGAAYRATGSSKGMCVGDELMTVNGTDLLSLTHDECISVFKDMPLRVQLSIKRGQKNLPAVAISPLHFERKHALQIPRSARRDISDSEDEALGGFVIYQVDIFKDPNENLGLSIVPSYGSTKEFYQNQRIHFHFYTQPGTTGTNCDVAVTTGCTTDPCRHGATCQDLGSGLYHCVCADGYTGPHCDLDLDDCIAANCEDYQVCVDLVNGYRCDCPVGKSGDLCNLYTDHCVSSPCQHSATCIDEGDRYVCQCLQGYAGVDCEVQSDPCYPDPCLHGSQCHQNFSVATGYHCKCATGFIGQRCEAKILECLSYPCKNGGTCLENIGIVGYTCQCTELYTGRLCDNEYDGCLTTSCQNGGACVKSDKGHVCSCPVGWEGVNCESDVNECTTSPCVNSSTCINVAGTYLCICTQYWMGRDCGVDSPECNYSPCHNNATCVEVVGGPPKCHCDQGTTGDLCETVLDGCSPNHCDNGAMCTDHRGNYTCTCQSGYTGKTCDSQLDMCATFAPCLHNATCTSMLNDYVCHCTPGFSNKNCSLNIDDCDPDPCLHGNCTDGVNEYRCSCSPGYKGTNCDLDVDECDLDPCMNNATCVNLENDFQCECAAGFTGDVCEVNIDDCDPDPCYHGSQCVDKDSNYICVCIPGYQGENCSEDIQECISSPCLHGGTCTEPVVNGYHCDCLPGIHGDDCQLVTMATFDGTQLVSLPPLTANQNVRKRSVDQWEKLTRATPPLRRRRDFHGQLHLSFTFTTSILRGILLLATGKSPMGQHHHFAVVLADEKIHISQDLAGHTMTASILLSLVDSIVSHSVDVIITPSETNVTLDRANCNMGNNCHVTLRHDLIDQDLNLNRRLVIGGVDHMTPYLRSKLQTDAKYTGCFGDLMINGEPVSLLPDTQNPLQGSQSNLPSAGCMSHDPCTPDFCQNGGVCVDEWSRKYCRCQPGFIGTLCDQQNVAHFTPTSFLHFGNYSKIRTISLWVSTNSSTGIMMYTLDLDVMSLYIEADKVVLHLVVNGDDIISRVGDLHNGNWYHVRVEFGQGVYRLQLAHLSDAVIATATGTVGNLLDVHMPVFLGQLHDHPAIDKWRGRREPLPDFHSFDGCVQNFTINGQPMDLQNGTPSVFGNDPQGPTPGCPREEVCHPSPCQQGGVCYGGWSGHTCECQPSFTGENCQEGQPVTFNGDTSYLELHLETSKVAFGDSGSFEFRSRDQTATLMFIQFHSTQNSGRSASLEFSLYRTSLQVSLTLEQAISITFAENLSNGNWHTAFWVRGHGSITVTQGERSLSLATDFDPYDDMMTSNVTVYVGGKPFNPGVSNYKIGVLKGCVRGVEFNEIPIPYLGPTDSKNGIIVLSNDLRPGCHSDVSCVTDPCPDNSECSDLWNARNCTCHDGWTGAMCNQSIDDCVQNMCQNGATCVDSHMAYYCTCADGYTGLHCEAVSDPCTEAPCSIEGSVNCTFIFPERYQCYCKSGWTGVACAVEVNECKSSPCLHNGVCRDLVNGFSCDCPRDYFGNLCEEKRICSSHPCFNGGSCSAYENNTDYICSCLPRYSGKQCQTYDFCADGLCQNNATCVSSSEGYSCDCVAGFYGAHCQFIDYCSVGLCLNNGECYNDKHTFRCSCGEFFSGVNCELPINRCDISPCLNGAKCFQNSTEQSLQYVCMCLDGFTGTHCETDIDECASDPCLNGASCYESNQQPWRFFPGYRCQCVDGFYGDRCENETDECSEMLCSNNGTCLDLVGGFQCSCLAGFEGVTCSIDKRGCSSNPCANNAICSHNTDSTYQCDCQNGYTGQLCQTDINDCEDNMCEHGSLCVDLVNGYKCECLAGYGGEHCSDVIDACYTQPCSNNGTCVYRGLCDCADVVQSCGWHNETCQKSTCQQNLDCTPYVTSFTCDCSDTGFHGDTCEEDVNECLVGSACEHRGVCSNTLGSYMCNCRDTGYTGSRCEVDIDECSGPSPCFNGGVCENFSGSFKCLCPAGWTGQTCGQLQDNCADRPCKHSGRCINNVQGFLCDCSGTGYQGPTCDLNENNCIGNPCLNNGRCVDGVNTYTCDCAGTGYHGDKCEIETDDCASSPCKNNGTCTDEGRRFVCDCAGTGFTGQFCDVDLNECALQTHRCQVGSTCENRHGGYACFCTEYMSGLYCEIDLRKSTAEPVSDTNVDVVVVSVVVIIVLLLAVVTYVVWYSRKSRRLKGHYKPSQAEQAGAVPGIPLDKIIDPLNSELLI